MLANWRIGATSMQQELSNQDLHQGFTLGEWLVRPLANKLTNDDGDVHVEPKVMDVLLCLADSKHEVVTRGELIEKVWDRVVVNEEALTRTISELRTVLGDNPRDPTYIKTIPKRGYTLVANTVTTGMADITKMPQPEFKQIPSIAVLPFANLSTEPDNEYFSDGLSEELISMLTQIRGLHVAARTSAFAFKNQAISTREIGEQLNVTHILEGSVRKSSTNFRITTQLVDVASGYQIWSESFDRKTEDIFAVQEGIAEAVVEALKIQLGVDHQFSVTRTPPGGLDAYELFLRGRLKYQNEQRGMTYSGIDELEQAVKIAPNFPDAHGLKAYIHSLNSITQPYGTIESTIEKSYQAALKVNPFQEEALMAKAIAVRWQSWDWVKVKSMFERALAAAPNCPHVLTQFACRFYRDLCEFQKAQVLLEQAVRLDPINAGPRASLSFVLRYQGNYEAALTEAERAVSINSAHGYANFAKLLALISLENFAAAAAMIEQREQIVPSDDVLLLNCRTRLYQASGDTARAKSALADVTRLMRQSRGEQFMPLAGWFYMMQDDVEQSVFWLEKGLEHRISQILNTRAFAQILDNEQRDLLRNPILQSFLGRMNLDDQSLNRYRDSGLFEDVP